MAKILLKTVAAEIGMEEKVLRKHLRDNGFKKSERQWSWEEGHPDLVKIKEEAPKWKEEAKPTEPEPVTEESKNDVETVNPEPTDETTVSENEAQ